MGSAVMRDLVWYERINAKRMAHGAWRPILLTLCAWRFALNASAQEAKPLAELDALRLERAELEVRALTAEIQARQERIERIKSEAVPYLAGLRQRDKAEGCQLDLGGRKWICPKAQSAEGIAPSVEPKKE